MKVGMVQFSPCWEDIKGSIRVIDEMILKINSPLDVLVFPEMSLTGFSMKSELLAEELDGEATQYFMRLAGKLKTDVICGVIEKEGREVYNSLIHFDQTGLLRARYRKIHTYAPARENEFYKSSDELVVTDLNHSRIGLSICYDLRFPELYRFYSKLGVDILVDIASWPSPRISHWTALLKARAIENQCFMIGVNRTGNDPFNSYPGCSAIFDPMGNELISCGDSSGIFTCELDLNLIARTRDSLPFLKDMKLL